MIIERIQAEFHSVQLSASVGWTGPGAKFRTTRVVVSTDDAAALDIPSYIARFEELIWQAAMQLEPEIRTVVQNNVRRALGDVSIDMSTERQMPPSDSTNMMVTQCRRRPVLLRPRHGDRVDDGARALMLAPSTIHSPDVDVVVRIWQKVA